MIKYPAQRKSSQRDSPLLYHLVKSPVGELFIGGNPDKGLSLIIYLKDTGLKAVLDKLSRHYTMITHCPDDPLLLEVSRQLSMYFNGELRNFDVTIDLIGTSFQMVVWNALVRIPYGKTMSYSDIAEMARREKAVRAVGSANNRNPVPIIIPCHRVIAKNGQLSGYASGTEIKQWLIDHEKRNL